MARKVGEDLTEGEGPQPNRGTYKSVRLPNAEFSQTRNEPKTRYSGHTFSRLARVWTQPHLRVGISLHMGVGVR
jgi:hypothetical protein